MASPRRAEGVSGRAHLAPVLKGHEVGEDPSLEGGEIDLVWTHGFRSPSLTVGDRLSIHIIMRYSDN